MRNWSIIVAPLFWCLMQSAGFGQEKCNTALDWVVQARERARPGLGRTQLEKTKALLDRATGLCSDLGDAWYYRSVYARELGDQREAAYAERKAEQFDSQALRYRDDPFATSTSVATAPSSSPQPRATTSSPSEKPRSGSEDAAPALRPMREKWALVVGIGRYRDRNIPSLKYTAKDAKNFAALLTDPKIGRFKPANVALLTDEQATEKNIRAEIGRLMDNVMPDDLVVCYISSHGSPRKGGQSEINYIVTHDTDVSQLYATSLAMVDVVDHFSRRIRAQRVVLFLDACYSGAAAEVFSDRLAISGAKSLDVISENAPGDLLSRVDRTVGRVVISASKDNEPSWESDRLQNSVFTYYLMEGLRLEQGKATIEQVYGHLKEKVPIHVRSERGANVSQTPLIRGDTQHGRIDIRIGVEPRLP